MYYVSSITLGMNEVEANKTDPAPDVRKLFILWWT
jgi:hypothetical protein